MRAVASSFIGDRSATGASRPSLPLRRLEPLHRTDLDAAEARRRDPRRELDRFVQVARLDQDEAAELLLGLEERAVAGRDPPAGARSHDGRAARALERLTEDEVPALAQLLVVGERLAHEGVVLAGAEGIQRVFVVIDHARVLHAALVSVAR